MLNSRDFLNLTKLEKIFKRHKSKKLKLARKQAHNKETQDNFQNIIENKNQIIEVTVVVLKKFVIFSKRI